MVFQETALLQSHEEQIFCQFSHLFDLRPARKLVDGFVALLNYYCLIWAGRRSSTLSRIIFNVFGEEGEKQLCPGSADSRLLPPKVGLSLHSPLRALKDSLAANCFSRFHGA